MNFRNLNYLLDNPLNLDYLGYLYNLFNHLLNEFLHFNNSVHNFNDWNKFFNHLRNLLNLVLNDKIVNRHSVYYILRNDPLDNLLDYFDLDSFGVNFNNFLDKLRNLHNPFIILFNHYNFLHNSLYLDRHLDWDGHWFLDLEDLFDFKGCCNDLLYFNRLGNLGVDYYYLLDVVADLHYLLNNGLHRDHLLHNSVDHFFNFNIDVLYYFNLHDLLLEYRYLHLFLNLNDLLDLHYSIDNVLYYLGNLHNLFDDSWHYDDLLDDLLDLHYLRNFNHLFNELFNVNFNLLDPFYNFRHRDDPLNYGLYDLIVLHIVDHGFFDLNNIVYYNYLLYNSVNFYDPWNLNMLDFHPVDYLRNSNDSLLEERNLNLPLNYLLDLFDKWGDSVDYSLDLFNLVDWDYLLPDDFHLFDLEDLLLYCDYFFDDLRNLEDLLNVIVDNNDLLNDSVDYLNRNFDLDIILLDDLVLSVSNNFLDHLFDLNNLRNVDDPFDNLLNVHGDLDSSVDDLFNRNNNFPDNFHFPHFNNWFLHYFLHFHDIGLNNDFFYDLLYFHNFRNFNDSLYHFLNVLGDFLDHFDHPFNFYYLLHNIVHELHNLHWDVDDLFDLLNLRDFNNLLNNLLNWDYLRNFYDSFNHLLDDLLNFNDLGVDSEDLQDVIHIDNIHDFLPNHLDHALIKF